VCTSRTTTQPQRHNDGTLKNITKKTLDLSDGATLVFRKSSAANNAGQAPTGEAGTVQDTLAVTGVLTLAKLDIDATSALSADGAGHQAVSA
jgi:hypothetical protein